MTNIWKWSKTPPNNSTIALPDINWQENQAPSTVNNSSRNEMAHMARYRDDLGGAAVTLGGTVDNVTLITNANISTEDNIPDGYTITWRQSGQNTGAMTLAVDGQPPKPLRRSAESPIVEFASGSFKEGEYVTAIYSEADDIFLGRGGQRSSRIGLSDLDPSISGALVPVGTIVPWAHDTLPGGYYECNGQELSRSDFPDLFTAIGTYYGDGNGTTTFNLPDYRGRFLRVQDGGIGRDPDRTSRTDRGDGTTGDNVGTIQEGEYENHTHPYDLTVGQNIESLNHSHTYIELYDPTSVSGPAARTFYEFRRTSNTSSSGDLPHTHSLDGTIDPAGGSETRPTNVYVKYIIFASPAQATGNPVQLNTIWNQDVNGGVPTGTIGVVGDFLIDPASGIPDAYYIWGPKVADGTWTGSDRVDLIPGGAGGGGDAVDIVFDPDLATYGTTPYVSGVDTDVQLALDRVGSLSTTNQNNINTKAPIDDPVFTTGITTPVLSMNDQGGDTTIAFEGAGSFIDWQLIHDANGTNDLNLFKYDSGGLNPQAVVNFDYDLDAVSFPLGTVSATGGTLQADRTGVAADSFVTSAADNTHSSHFALSDENGLQWSMYRNATDNNYILGRWINGSSQGNILEVANTTGDITVSSNSTFNGTSTFTALATGTAGIAVSAPAGTDAEFWAQTSGVSRWSWGKDSTTESGGNVGSDWVLKRYNDLGGLEDIPIEVLRDTGAIHFSNQLRLTNSSGDGYLDMAEQLPVPGVPGPNVGRLYTQDIGGNTHLLYANDTDANPPLDLISAIVDTGEANILSTPTSVSQDDRLDRSKTGVQLNLKRFIAGAGITITSTNSDSELTIAASAAGSGDVIGPGASTDQALARYDGVTGKLLQNSGIVVTDLNDMTGVNNITGTLGSFVTGSSGSDGHGAAWDASGNLTSTGSPVGDVAGPAGAVDNAVARFDATTGKLIQDSTVQILDTADMINVNDYQGTGIITTTGTLIEVKHTGANDVEIGLDTQVTQNAFVNFEANNDTRWNIGKQASTNDFVIERWTGGAGGSLASEVLNLDTVTGNGLFAHDWQITGNLIVDTNNTFAGYSDISDITEPGAVGANTGRLYSKDVGGNSHLFWKNDGDFSTALDLTTGGGGGTGGPSLGTNAVIRTNATNIIEDITVYDHAATVTADTGANTLSLGTDNDYLDGDTVQLLTTGTLPAPLATDTMYYVVNITATTLQVAATYNGAPIALTTTGSGTHTLYQAINGMSAGPIVVESGFTVDVPSGSTYTVW